MVSAPVKLFNAIPLPSFSAAVNCAPQHPFHLFYLLFPCLLSSLMFQQSRAQYSTAVFRFFCVRFPRRTEALAKASRSLQPSQKAPFITEMEMLPRNMQASLPGLTGYVPLFIIQEKPVFSAREEVWTKAFGIGTFSSSFSSRKTASAID